MDNIISVLVVDQDIYMCYLFELVFDSFNVSCSTVNTIEEAKIELETYIPTFIILDNSFPDGKGLDLTEYLNRNYPCIKIVIFAGDYSDTQVKDQSEKIYQVIEKPFTVEKMKIVIDNLIKIPKCTKEQKCFKQECSRLVDTL